MINIISQKAENIGTKSIEKKIFWTICSLLFILAIYYGYLINSTISAVVLKESNESKISALRTNIANLEFSYIEKKNSINESLAFEKGFYPVKTPSFISINTASKPVSMNSVKTIR